MVRDLKRWLSVVGAVSLAVSSPVLAEGTPVDCGTAECEAIREMRTLYHWEQNFFGEKDRYTADFGEPHFSPPFSPAPCTDGSRAAVPGPGWIAGCRFAYKVTSVTPLPSPTFTAVAQGAAGTPAAGITLQVGAPSYQDIVFWLERDGQRRFVGLDECQPAPSFTCDAQVREGVAGIRALFFSEKALFAEKDRYSANFQELGFAPLSCTDGSRATVPDSSWIGGCRFIYRVNLTSISSFTLTARSVSGATEGTVLTVGMDGNVDLRPIYGERCW